LQNKPFSSYEADIHYHLGISLANLELFEFAVAPLTKVCTIFYSFKGYIIAKSRAVINS